MERKKAGVRISRRESCSVSLLLPDFKSWLWLWIRIFRSHKVFRQWTNETKLEAISASFNKFQSFNHNLSLKKHSREDKVILIYFDRSQCSSSTNWKGRNSCFPHMISVPQVRKDYQLSELFPISDTSKVGSTWQPLEGNLSKAYSRLTCLVKSVSDVTV